MNSVCCVCFSLKFYSHVNQRINISLGMILKLINIIFHLCTGITLDKSKAPSLPLEAVLEPELIAAIAKLLDDRNSQVRVAAAITLYSLNKPSDKVILFVNIM